MSDDIYMQPISNVTEGHASEQLGLHAYTEYRETVALKDTLARYAYLIFISKPNQVLSQNLLV